MGVGVQSTGIVKIERWGDDLAIRISPEMATAVGLQEGNDVKSSIKGRTHVVVETRTAQERLELLRQYRGLLPPEIKFERDPVRDMLMASKQTHPSETFCSTYALCELMTPRELFCANPLERIYLVREGLPVCCAFHTAVLLCMTPARFLKMLGMPLSSICSKSSACKRLTQDQSERVIAVRFLIGQSELIMDDAKGGSKHFDVGAWVGAWIKERQPALGNQSPAELMDTVEGRQLVSRLLAQNATGAYV